MFAPLREEKSPKAFSSVAAQMDCMFYKMITTQYFVILVFINLWSLRIAMSKILAQLNAYTEIFFCVFIAH